MDFEDSIHCLPVADEYALVSAARDMGAVFFRRTPASVIIDFVIEHAGH